jgi:hypothetical protein
VFDPRTRWVGGVVPTVTEWLPARRLRLLATVSGSPFVDAAAVPMPPNWLNAAKPRAVLKAVLRETGATDSPGAE